MTLTPAHGARPPEPEHRPLVSTDPQEYSITGEVTMGKLQGHLFNVKCLRRFGAPNRQVRFVKVHKLWFDSTRLKFPTATPTGWRSQFNKGCPPDHENRSKGGRSSPVSDSMGTPARGVM